MGRAPMKHITDLQDTWRFDIWKRIHLIIEFILIYTNNHKT